MEDKQVFLSHSSSDRNLAEIIALYLSKVTLRQFTVWHSSDSSGTGGIKIGSVWFDEIRKQLENSKVILVLLTPNSIDKPWLYFESGFGQALKNCEVIPLLVGLSKFSDVTAPLSLYQSFNITDYGSLKKFTNKLLSNYNIPFEEDLAEGLIQKTISAIIEELKSMESSDSNDNEIDLENLKNYLDNRFNDIKTILTSQTTKNKEIILEAKLQINTNKSKFSTYLEIESNTTLGNVLNKIYFMIRDEISPFTYMEKWVLRDLKTKKLLIIREVQDYIPANIFFNNKFHWEVILLNEPYNLIEINKRDRDDFFDNS